MPPTLEESIADIAEKISGVKAELSEKATNFLAKVKENGEATTALKADVDKALSAHNEVTNRLGEIEKVVARLGDGQGDTSRKSLGRQFVESDDWKSFADGTASKQASFVKKFKNVITSLTTDADGSAGDLIIRDRRPGIIGMPERKMTMRDLISVGRTGSNLIEYVKETGFTNAAAMQATEGASKAESTMKFEVFSAPVRTLAHFVRASKQVLDDAAQLETWINAKLIYGLKYVEDNQILNSTGSGVTLDGIMHQAIAFDPQIVVPLHNSIDTIRLAILQVYLAQYPADGVVLNPIDWAGMELTKDEEGRYIFGNPQSQASQTLWRLPVVDTQAQAQDSFLVGAFKLGATLWDREDANVQVSNEDADNFTKNLVTIRAEERLALTVERPESFVKGTFGGDS